MKQSEEPSQGKAPPSPLSVWLFGHTIGQLVCVCVCVLSSLTGVWGCESVGIAACATILGVQLTSGLSSNKRWLIKQRLAASYSLSAPAKALFYCFTVELLFFCICFFSSLQSHPLFERLSTKLDHQLTGCSSQGTKLYVITIRFIHRKYVVKVAGRYIIHKSSVMIDIYMSYLT